MILVLLFLFAIPDLTPEQAEAVRKIISEILKAADDAMPETPPPPTFAPTQEDRQAGNVLPWSPEGGADPTMESPENGNLPKLPSPKRCLCGPECGCGGDCDPCPCLFNKLPKPGPGPLLSKQPIVGENHDR